MTTSFAGIPINRNNIPQDWFVQLSKILDDMQSMGIQHNDMIEAKFNVLMDQHNSSKIVDGKVDILVQNGKLYLVDFGWASLNGSFSVCDGVVNTVPFSFGTQMYAD